MGAMIDTGVTEWILLLTRAGKTVDAKGSEMGVAVWIVTIGSMTAVRVGTGAPEAGLVEAEVDVNEPAEGAEVEGAA